MVRRTGQPDSAGRAQDFNWSGDAENDRLAAPQVDAISDRIRVPGRRANVAEMSGSRVSRDESRGPACIVNVMAGVNAYVEPKSTALDVWVSSPLMKWRTE